MLNDIVVAEPTSISFLNKHFASIECDASLNEFSFTVDRNYCFYYETQRFSFFKMFVENIDDVLDTNTNDLYVNFEIHNPSEPQETVYFLFTFRMNNDMKLRLVQESEKYLNEISIDGVGRRELLEKVLQLYFKESRAKIMGIVNEGLSVYEYSKVRTMPRVDKDKGCVVV